MWSSNKQQTNESTKRPSKDDLHQWSIYRQNLNAAITNNSSSSTINSTQSNDLILKQETVNNILSSTNFKNKSSDADHYLKYGLPRVKNPIEDNQRIEEQLAGKVKNQIKLFNERQNELAKTDKKINAKLIRKNSNQNLNLKDDLNYNLRKEPIKNDSKCIKSNEISKNSSKNQLSNRPDIEPLTDSLRNKQWKSNPNLQDELLNVTECCLTKQFKDKQSLSEYDVRRRYSDANIQNRLEQFKQYQNNQQQTTNREQLTKSDDDSLTKSIAKSSPCDELDFRKSSLNEDDLSFEHNNKLPKYAKTNGLQSSDSEFVLSLDGGKSAKTKQPHLIVNKLYHEFDSTSNLSLLCGGPRQKIRVLDNISFECKPGDMMALIATNQLESSTILDIMMNQHSKTRTRTLTEFYLNGQSIDAVKLSKFCAYVGPNSNLCDKMSTRQTILFFNLLQSTTKENNTFDSKKRIDALIEELGLTEVKHTCVGNLNESEKIRLQIAIALMSDTDLLLLDQPIRSMDVFDSYFIVDYIRQWTLMSNKIAILALQPPSYETLSLFSKVSFISTGRTVYFGDRSKMNVYFTYADYPCPSYKNPADYYLDLITVDHLSSSAMLESNHRIESLIQIYQKGKKQFKKGKPLTNHLILPDVKRKSFLIDFLSLWVRAMIFCFPYNVINLAKRLLLAVSLSLICGCIFFKMRLGKEQETIWDRFGFYHSLLALFSMPLFLHEIKEIHHEKKHVLEELRMKFYSKEAYFLSYLIYTFPGASMCYLGFVLPASSIAIQKPDLIYYITIMLCYLHVIRLLTIAVSWCFSTKIRSCIAFGFVYFSLIMISGNNLHEKNINIISRLVHNLSIYTYTYESLINWEFDNSNNATRSTNNHYHLINQRFLCSGNPLIEHNALVARAECGFQNRNHIIEYLSLNNYFTNWTQPLFIYLSYSSVLLFIWYCILCVLTTNNSHLLQAQTKLKETSFKRRSCKPEYL